MKSQKAVLVGIVAVFINVHATWGIGCGISGESQAKETLSPVSERIRIINAAPGPDGGPAVFDFGDLFCGQRPIFLKDGLEASGCQSGGVSHWKIWAYKSRLWRQVIGSYGGPLAKIISWGLTAVFDYEAELQIPWLAKIQNLSTFDIDICPQLPLGGFRGHIHTGLRSLGGTSSGDSGPSGEEQRGQYGKEANRAQYGLSACPIDGIFRCLSHPYLLAQIGFVMVLGLSTVWFVNGGIGLLLLGTGCGAWTLGAWSRPRLVGGLLVLLGSLCWGGSVWLCFALAG